LPPSAGQKWKTPFGTDEFGFWVFSLPPGTYDVTVQIPPLT
jgi:hypothetical protein